MEPLQEHSPRFRMSFITCLETWYQTHQIVTLLNEVSTNMNLLNLSLTSCYHILILCPVFFQFCPLLWTWWTSASRWRAVGEVMAVVVAAAVTRTVGGVLWEGKAARRVLDAERDLMRQSWSRWRWNTCLPAPELLRGFHWTQVTQTKPTHMKCDNRWLKQKLWIRLQLQVASSFCSCCCSFC